jgi:hypothetical protein
MITPSQGAERTQLVKWATPRLLRYFKSRRKSMIIYHNAICGWDAGNVKMEDMATKQEMQTWAAMQAELDFIQNILYTRAHVQKHRA